MRRMRDIAWQYYLLALPVVVIALSAGYLLKDRYRAPLRKYLTLKGDVKDTKDGATQSGQSAQLASDEVPASPPVSATIATARGMNSSACRATEYGGSANVQVSVADWSQLMALYHEAKADILGWLDQHRDRFSPDALVVMQQQIRDIRVQRPPSQEEPDLAWRGISVWSADQQGVPMIRVGGGFLQLVKKDPKRAKFELARLISQTWSPCELKKMKLGNIWKSTLDCLNLKELDFGCSEGSYSESGWAVSTAVALTVANPGCSIPAFNGADIAKCLKAKEPGL